ncbi:shikimate kinase [Leptolyngbya sp. 'hensonii']|uniref:shikimate kinase n=1 Tax=Leptolyngbya sp. 'hensonii' TaxID=1922337 RepID=UPI00094F93C0|nr:shikimate kinase [Leptolyngbya sp. 'hensonii']OLP16778.1 shikimate kinase [Leptolyngbya sp. 'hensonii']
MTNSLKNRSLFLIGMMGAGKTTIGHLLAKQLHYRFFDTDALIEQVKGQSVTEIFRNLGEAEFRKLESQVLAELSACTCSVIATGGGIVLQRMNWSYLYHGIVVWLDVPVEQLYRRLQADSTRPLLNGTNPLERLQHLHAERHHLYAQADLRVSIAENEFPTQVAQRILELIPGILKPEAVPPDLAQN